MALSQAKLVCHTSLEPQTSRPQAAPLCCIYIYTLYAHA